MKTKTSLLLAVLALLPVSCASPGGTAASGVKPYPKDTCIVTGNKLGSMGAVQTTIYQGQEVKFCCKPCVKKFDANPTKYLSTL